jgi:GTPase SAR1 family protein
VAVVGNYAVGKTTLLVRIVEKRFQEQLSVTVGSDAISYVHDDRCEIVFTDTAGEERFKVRKRRGEQNRSLTFFFFFDQAMTSSFYRNCAALLFVYDVTDDSKFGEVAAFVQEGNRFNEKSVKVRLIAYCHCVANFVH